MSVYFDESGTHDGSPVCCVAGYLFESEQADRLDKEWIEALTEYGISYFHAVDCAHGIKEFKKLSGKQRKELVIRLVGIIKRRMTIGVAVSVSDTDFKRLTPPQWAGGSPYVVCAMQAIGGVAVGGKARLPRADCLFL